MIIGLHKKAEVAYIGYPKVTYIGCRFRIVTDSYATFFFAAMPSNFTVNLTCTIMDTSGKQISVIKATGEGSAEYPEFLHVPGLAGKRAMEDALMKMKRSLFEVDYREAKIDTRPESPIMSKDSVPERPERLKGLNDRGLITPEEFQKKKNEILGRAMLTVSGLHI